MKLLKKTLLAATAILAIPALVIGTAMIALPAIALAGIAMGDMMGKTDAEIAEAMAAKGYEVVDIEREDDEIEVEAVIDGQEVEIALSPETGEVIEIELEDDDDDDGEDDDEDGRSGN